MAAQIPTGRFNLVATIKAKGEKEAAEIAALLEKVTARANSDEEPNCLYYKPVRSISDPNTFVVIEEYDNKGSDVATSVHRAGADYQQLMKIAPTHTAAVDIQFYTAL